VANYEHSKMRGVSVELQLGLLGLFCSFSFALFLRRIPDTRIYFTHDRHYWLRFLDDRVCAICDEFFHRLLSFRCKNDRVLTHT